MSRQTEDLAKKWLERDVNEALNTTTEAVNYVFDHSDASDQGFSAEQLAWMYSIVYQSVFSCILSNSLENMSLRPRSLALEMLGDLLDVDVYIPRLGVRQPKTNKNTKQ